MEFPMGFPSKACLSEVFPLVMETGFPSQSETVPGLQAELRSESALRSEPQSLQAALSARASQDPRILYRKTNNIR